MEKRFLKQLKQSPPVLVASLDGDDLASLMEEAKLMRADAVEIRLDLWGDFLRDQMFEKMARLREKIALPMIVAFRGGRPYPVWWQPAHWRALHHAAAVDVEWNSTYRWREIAQRAAHAGTALVISHHDFTRTPPTGALKAAVRSAFAKRADLVKVATHVKSDGDLRRLFELSQEFTPKRLLSVMGMGPLGPLSRLVAPLFGSCLVYGFLGRPTAPGQLPYKELQERVRRLYPGYDQQFRRRLHEAASI